MNIIFTVFLWSMIMIPAISVSQDKTKKKKEESFMDKVQKVIEIRRSFDLLSETTKPALLSFKKNEGEKAVFTTDFAVAYRGFRYAGWGISPSVQFDYSSSIYDQLERLTGRVNTYYEFYKYSGGSGRVEPGISYSKGFYSKIDEQEAELFFIPRFPKLFIPVMNISDIKFKYDGKDNRWIFGLNPSAGITYLRMTGGSRNINDNNTFGTVAASITARRYYLMIEVYGRYESEFPSDRLSRYKYESTLSFYFDERERSSINARFEQEEKEKRRKRKITIGFGIKL